MGCLSYCKKIIIIISAFQITFATMNIKNDEFNFEEDVNVAFIPNHDSKTVQMNVSWTEDVKGVVGIIVEPLSNDTKTVCRKLTCTSENYNLRNSSMALFPEFPSIPSENDVECSFYPGCKYSIKLVDNNHYLIINRDIIIPECILDDCNCTHKLNLTLNANALDLDIINITWTIDLENDLKLDNNIFKDFLISVTQINSSIPWGDLMSYNKNCIAEETYRINISTLSSNTGNVQIKTITPMLSNTHYLVFGRIFDILNNCIETDVYYKFHYTDIGNNLDWKFCILFIIFIFFVLGIVIYFYHKRKQLKEEKNKSVRINIPLMENIIYTPADCKRLLDKFEIDPKNIHLGERIGQGAFGEVFKGKVQNLNGLNGITQVAIKRLKMPNGIMYEEELEDFLEEIEVMKRVGRHENIVYLIGCCTKMKPFMMVMEYVGVENLSVYLKSIRNKISSNSNFITASPRSDASPKGRYLDLLMSAVSVDSEKMSRSDRPSLSETVYTTLSEHSGSDYIKSIEYKIDNKELHNFALQIANGMAYLESIKIVHRDLAARNVLIDDKKNLKISDFGLSRNGVIYIRRTGKKIPARWCSIEALKDNLYTTKSDVWAYGVVLWEIGNLSAHPYENVQNADLLNHLMSGERLEKPGICSDELYDLMLDCWKENFNERPSFKQILTFLRVQYKNIYIDLEDSDYVFPPVRLEIPNKK